MPNPRAMSEKKIACWYVIDQQMDQTWEFHFLKYFKCVLIVRKLSSLRYLATCAPKLKHYTVSVYWMVFDECTHIHHVSQWLRIRIHYLQCYGKCMQCNQMKWFGPFQRGDTLAGAYVCECMQHNMFWRIIFIFVKWVHFDLSFSFFLSSTLPTDLYWSFYKVFFTCNSPNKQINDIKSNHCTEFRCLFFAYFNCLSVEMAGLWFAHL